VAPAAKAVNAVCGVSSKARLPLPSSTDNRLTLPAELAVTISMFGRH
jgi:hypothetical protein